MVKEKVTQKKVLLVDDNQVFRDSLAGLLRAEKVTVFTAPNGVDGLLSALEHKPDLLLLDINMPEMNGLKMLKKVRSEAWGKKVPILMLTASTDSKNLREAIDLGTTDYLVKDQWEAERIIAYIKGLLH
jgi:CheY-like chemotaxis protein